MARAGFKITVGDALERMTRERAKEMGIDRMDPRYLVLLGEMAILKGETFTAIACALAATRRFKEGAELCVLSKEAKAAIKEGGSEKDIKARYIKAVINAKKEAKK